MMRATLTLAGISYPMISLALRREPGAATLDVTLAGRHAISPAAPAVLAVTGHTNIIGSVTRADPRARSTQVAIAIDQPAGSAAWEPRAIQVASSGRVRVPADFAVLPGDSYLGMVIQSATTTPWTTEVTY